MGSTSKLSNDQAEKSRTFFIKKIHSRKNNVTDKIASYVRRMGKGNEIATNKT